MFGFVHKDNFSSLGLWHEGPTIQWSWEIQLQDTVTLHIKLCSSTKMLLTKHTDAHPSHTDHKIIPIDQLKGTDEKGPQQLV